MLILLRLIIVKMRYRKPSYPYQPELTLKTNLVQRVLRKLRQPNIFCKFAKTSFEHCQPVFVCVLLTIGMAAVYPRRGGGWWRHSLHEPTSLLLFKLEEKITATQNFCKYAKTSLDCCKPVFVCVLLAIGMATM